VTPLASYAFLAAWLSLAAIAALVLAYILWSRA